VHVHAHGHVHVYAPAAMCRCETLGLHSSLPFLSSLYDNGDAALIANVGSLIEPVSKAEYNDRQRSVALPPKLFSHNDQQRAVESVHPQALHSHGVLGRLLDAVRSKDPPLAAGGYSLNGHVKMLEGQRPADVIDKDDGVVRYNAYAELAPTIRKMVGNESSSLLAETFASQLSTALERTETLGSAMEGVQLNNEFGDTSVAKQLAQVARLISTHEQAGMAREAFFVDRGGFDMHNEVTLSLAERFAEIDDALRSFVAELQELGVWKDTVVLSASEFARTLNSNGLGTDHAWAGNHFLLGGSVRGGQVLGKYPRGLRENGPRSEQVLSRGRLVPTTSFDAVWGPIASWFGADEAQLNEVLPNRQRFSSEDLFTQDQVFKVGAS